MQGMWLQQKISDDYKFGHHDKRSRGVEVLEPMNNQ